VVLKLLGVVMYRAKPTKKHKTSHIEYIASLLFIYIVRRLLVSYSILNMMQ